MDGGKVAALAVGGIVVGALTAGIGLIAGMMVVGLGAAAGGTVALSNSSTEKEKILILACETLQDAELWVQALTSQIRELNLNNSSSHHIHLPDAKVSYLSRKHTPPPNIRLEEIEDWVKASKWRVACIEHGIRFYDLLSSYDIKSVKLDTLPCLKVSIGMCGSATDIYSAIMTLPPLCRTGIIKKLRVVDTIDNYTDIVHITFEPVCLSLTWTSPRDLCLLRYWRHNSDGTSNILYYYIYP